MTQLIPDRVATGWHVSLLAFLLLSPSSRAKAERSARQTLAERWQIGAAESSIPSSARKLLPIVDEVEAFEREFDWHASW